MSLLGIDIGGTKVSAARSWIRLCNSVEWRPLCLCTKPNDAQSPMMCKAKRCAKFKDAQSLVMIYRLLDFYKLDGKELFCK